MNRAEIIPAILPMDFAEVQDKIDLIKDYVKTVQIDICDGQFTPEATWPYRKHDDHFDRMRTEEEGLPGWEKLNFEIDLMADNPEEVVDEWVSVGASRIVIHLEAKGDIVATIEKLAGRVEVGLALNIDTPVEKIQDLGKSHEEGGISSIQLMGIDHVGFQGQEFDTKVIDKIREVRKLYPGIAISVDGGVSLDNAKQLIEAGATRLVVGSAIFNADNYLDTLQKLKAVHA